MKLDRKILLIGALVVFLVTASFGTKYLFLFNKGQDFVEYINYKMSRPALPLPKEIKNVQEFEFSRVTVAGNYVYKHEFLVKHKNVNGKASYQVFVPFKRASGQMVMVDRGLISEDTIGEIVRPKGLIKLEGVVVAPAVAEEGVQNDPEKDSWYWADLDAMAKKAKVNKFLPVIIKAIEKYPYPVSDKIRVVAGVENLNLAVIWYALSLLILFLLRLNYQKYR